LGSFVSNGGPTHPMAALGTDRLLGRPGGRSTEVVEMFSVRVHVTEEFPFLVTKWSSYFDR
jgi:hypothetical protein